MDSYCGSVSVRYSKVGYSELVRYSSDKVTVVSITNPNPPELYFLE